MSILLDSNIWLSILTCDGFLRAFWRNIRGRFRIVASEWLYAEVNDKLMFKFDFRQMPAARLTRHVRERTISMGLPNLPAPVCRDRDDDCVLAAAVAGACRFIITGDKDLLVLGEFEGIRIVTAREFLTLFEAGEI